MEVVSIAADQVVVDAAIRTLQAGETINADASSFDIWDNFVPFNTTASGGLQGATDVEVSAVVAAMGFNAFIFVAVIAIYECAFRTFPSVYRSNRRNNDVVVLKSRLPLAWVPSILRVSWSQVRTMCGLDAYFFLRYIRFCFQVTAVTGLWGLGLLWPIYASGGNGAGGWYHLSMANLESGSWKLWFPTIFMCLLTFYLIFLLREEYQHYVDCRMEFLAKGDSHVHPQQRYSLLVEDIPNDLRSDKALGDYFEQLFPNRVHSSCVVLNVPDLMELYQRRDTVLRRVEKIAAIQEITGKRPFHKIKVQQDVVSSRKLPWRRSRVNLYEQDSRLPSQGERVDSINYYTKYLQILNEKLAELQEDKMTLAKKGDMSRRASEWLSHSLQLIGSSKKTDIASGDGDGLIVSTSGTMNITSGLFLLIRKVGVDFICGGAGNLNRPLDAVVDTMVGRTLSSTGFVTFTDLVTVTCAVRAPLSHEAGVLSVQMAPDSRDVEWNNSHISKAWRSGREWTADVLLGLGAVLWSIPVTFIQALANLNSLASIPGLHGITELASSNPTLVAFINGYLPVLALIALIASLPPLFSVVASKYERRQAKSDIQHSIIKRFFYYQLANIYITVTAGSILDSISDILDHPSNAFAILGKSVPTVVGYFVMFVTTKVFAGLPVILLQVGPLLKRIFSILLCRDRVMTQRELDEEYRSVPLKYGQEYPNQLLVVVIMFTYAPIAPIILPVGALYFLAAFVVYKKQLLLVYSSTYESGGRFFPTACNRTMVGLVAAQVTLIGYTVLRAGFYQPMVLLPLPFYTIAMMSNFKHLYEDPSNYLSLERAIDLDKHKEVDNLDSNVYRQPNLVRQDLEPLPFRRTTDDVLEETSPNEKVV